LFHKGFYISLDKDVSEEYAEELMKAIRMMRHVQDVSAEVVDFETWVIRGRIGMQLWDEILPVLQKVCLGK